jgi:hypothetical protein
MRSDPQPPAGAAAAPGEPTPAGHPHDFEVQKQVHRRIRNDPDYDDWEYGTEPLPHEAWLARQAQGSPDPEGTDRSSEGSTAAG